MRKMYFINVVPFFPEDPGYMAQQARRIAKEVGLKSSAFSLSLHPEGTPARKKADVFAAAFAALKKDLAGDPDIRPGILLQSLIGHGWSAEVSLTGETWQKTINTQAVASSRQCPLDRGFRDYVLAAVESLAASRPAFFLVDDDFCIKRGECFCPLHMARYNERLSAQWSREELVKHLEAAPASDPVVQAVTAVLHEGLVDFAKEIRASIDKVAPGTRCGMCSPGAGQYSLADVTRALAGNTEPFVRLAGAIYGDAKPSALNWISRYTRVRALATEGVKDLIAESDTFPHNQYSASAAGLHAHITVGILNGLNGSKLWNTALYDKSPDSGRAYERIVAKNLGFYDALLNAVDGARWQGMETPLSEHRRDYHLLNPGQPLEFPDFITSLIGGFGIPYTYGNSLENRPRMLSGDHVDRFTDEEIQGFFHGGLLLDGLAARRLVARGFAEAMGVTIGERRDFFHTVEIQAAPGKRAAFMWDKGSTELLPAEGAREVTTLFHEVDGSASERKRQGAGMVFFENRFGGRVATVAFHTAMPYYKILLPSRRRWLVEACDFLVDGMLPFVVQEDQPVMARHGVLKDGSELLSLLNLSSDSLEGFTLRAARAFKSLQRLGCDGTWSDQSFHAVEGLDYQITCELKTYEPAIFKLSIH
jgi:hypothetical protein